MGTYESYLQTCSKESELGCRVPDFLAARASLFFYMYEQASGSNEPHLHLLQVLVEEGLELRRL
jgi:hypothetical protein